MTLPKDIDKIGKSLREPRPAKDELKAFLDALSLEVVMKLQTIMYAGRDKDPIPELYLHLKNNTVDKDDAIRTIMEKRSELPLYLAEGLKEAASQGVDLDRPFQNSLH